MPHENTGNYNEKYMVKSLNGIKVKNLSNNLRFLIRELFGTVDEEEIIEAGLVDGYIKPDIYIKCSDLKVYISIKEGSSTVVHQDKIDTFVSTLRSFNISEKTIRTILLFQFGDGTTDGSGKKREGYNEVKYHLLNDIAEANIELNKDKYFIKSMITKFVFKGNFEENIEADYLYHGTPEYGFVINKNQLFKHIDRRSWGYYDNLHIGPLLFRPHGRYVESLDDEPGRYKVDIYWPNLGHDVAYISERYNG